MLLRISLLLQTMCRSITRDRRYANVQRTPIYIHQATGLDSPWHRLTLKRKYTEQQRPIGKKFTARVKDQGPEGLIHLLDHHRYSRSKSPHVELHSACCTIAIAIHMEWHTVCGISGMCDRGLPGN